MYSYNDFKHDLKHDKLALIAVSGLWVIFFWLLIPSWMVRKCVDAYRNYGRTWFILSATNFIAAGIAMSIWIPALIKWNWCG